MAGAVCSLIIALLLCLLWGSGLWVRRRDASQPDRSAATASGGRLLQPRTPEDCPACRSPVAQSLAVPGPPPSVRPWHESKSRRGRPKRIATHGFACPNPACDYYRVTDAQIHALVGDGTHGTHERIQTFRCQACRTTFTSRRDTPLYRLKTSSSRVAEVLTAVAEGLSIAATVRVFGHSEGTITTWLA